MIQRKIQESIENFQKILSQPELLQKIQQAADAMIACIHSENKIMICGNGGSAADAQHFAGEFLCRFYRDRRPLPALALTTDTSTLTAIANDYSYEEIFKKQVEALGKSGDILVGISTSGSSKNVLRAFEAAKKKGIQTMLLTGATEREIALYSDLILALPSQDTPRIQEMHLLVEHILCEIVERHFIEN